MPTVRQTAVPTICGPALRVRPAATSYTTRHTPPPAAPLGRPAQADLTTTAAVQHSCIASNSVCTASWPHLSCCNAVSRCVESGRGSESLPPLRRAGTSFPFNTSNHCSVLSESSMKMVFIVIQSLAGYFQPRLAQNHTGGAFDSGSSGAPSFTAIFREILRFLLGELQVGYSVLQGG